MKYLTSLTTALFLGVSALNAQVTSEIVGYETITIKSGQYNLMGVRLLEDIEFSGSLSYDGTTFTSSSDFSTLTADTPYQLEINSGDNEGVVVAVELNGTSDGLELHEFYTSSTIPTFTDQEYKLRKAATVDSVFGADNTLGLGSTSIASPENADEVILRYGDQFENYFYFDDGNTTTWVRSSNGSFAPGGDSPIISTTAILVLKKSSGDIEFVLEGNVKSSATLLTYDAAYNYFGSVYPAGATLSNSGLSNTLTSTDVASYGDADEVLLSDGNGGFNRHIYFDNGSTATWMFLNESGSFEASNDAELTSGMIIVRQEGSSVESTISDRNFN